MTRMRFTEAVDSALAEAMAEDERILVLGEDVEMLHPELFARFGPERVMNAPISEAAFVGAAVGAAMAGLRPVVEVMMVDFIAVAFDAVLNHMAKLETLSGGTWRCPLVMRVACGGGYGDGGQHGQALWGTLGSIPGLTVVVPATPADAAGLLHSALKDENPVIFMEPKLLSESWLEFLGRGGRETVSFDVPAAGAEGDVVPGVEVPIGKAAVRCSGDSVTIVSLGVGVHRALEAAAELRQSNIECEVIDLRTVRPVDYDTVVTSVDKTGALIVVDEDYRECGLSGELAAGVLEAGLRPRFRRVCVEGTLPFARRREEAALPNRARIVAAAMEIAKD